MDRLVCLIVGDTPSTLLLSWRLSVSNCFTIFVSGSLPGDGIISWKSTKSSSGSYKPNVTVNDFVALSKVYKTGKIDIIIISSQSISQFNNQLRSLERFIHDDITIIIDSNFAVELEILSLAKYPNATTISVVTDAEVKRLSVGSYLLMSESTSFKFGISYDCDTKEKVLKENVNRYNNYSQDYGSNFKVLLEVLRRGDNMSSVDVILAENNVFGLLVWEWLIPKISLNILAIVFEHDSYDDLLENDSNAKVFRQLVQELMDIYFKQTNGGIIRSYISNDQKKPEYNAVVQRLKNRQRSLERSVGNKYPHCLTINYEAYCFYNEIAYPSSLLFEQCINLADKYDCGSSNLTFLSSLYCRQPNHGGTPLKNEHPLGSKKTSFLRGKKTIVNFEQRSLSTDYSQITKGRPKKVKVKGKQKSSKSTLKVTSKYDLKSPDLQLPQDIQEMYLGCDSINFSLPLTPKMIDIQFDTTSDDLQESSASDVDSDESISVHPRRERMLSQRSLIRVSANSNMHEDDNIDPSLKLPLFKGFKGAVQRPMTTGRLEMTDLEWQLRNGYADLPKQMLRATKDELKNNGAIRHQSLAGQYWKLIKQQHINNGQLARPITSQEDILRFHCETLTKSQVHLSTTTNRYGDLDFSDNIFEHWKQRKGSLYRLLSDR